MKRFKLILSVVLFSIQVMAFAQNPKPETKLRRADCFFGVHFDLHASEDIMDAGKTLTPEMVDTFLAKVRPDFIQIDCKGHPGITSYPTKVGYPVGGFEKDPLKLFREVTAKNNVALFMHYSGVWDSKAVKMHPDWAVIKSNGDVSVDKTCEFSPYLDNLMIPELKELSDYGVDGAWIDGDCWAVEPDYCAASISRFTRETGIIEIPRNQTDKYYPEWMEYTRSLFRERLAKYINAIHQYNPAFQITSNWSYSSMMPEPVNTNVDYLSGDVTPQNGVYRSAFEARCLAPQGKPWDLMAWGFSWNGAKMPLSVKSSVQLQQEAAQIMAMGGGVQFYFQQNRDLSLRTYLATTLSEIGAFCRARQAYVHKAKAIPQIALLYPTTSYQKSTSRPFWGSTAMLQGTLNAILDSQYPVEVLMEHHIRGKMQQYPLIVIPECNVMEPSFKVELDAYVQGGGKLLIIGTSTAKIFKQELGIQEFQTIEEAPLFIASDNRSGGVGPVGSSVKLLSSTNLTSTFYTSSDLRSKGEVISSSSASFGKGKVSGIYFNAGSTYLEYKSHVLRDFMQNQLSELFPQPLVKVQGSHLVHVAVNQKNNHTMVSLLNIAGDHTNPKAIGFDEIPPLTNLKVSINTGAKPSAIVLQPEGRSLDVDFKDGVSAVTVPELSIYSILEVKP